MKTLTVFYSKTGNTRKAAEAVIKTLGGDLAELQYNENTKKIETPPDPSGYEQLILLSPVWAFSLSEPMKLYLAQYGTKINRYSLIVTYSLGGLSGCVRNCTAAIGKKPEKAIKLKAKNVIAGNFDISTAL